MCGRPNGQGTEVANGAGGTSSPPMPGWANARGGANKTPTPSSTASQLIRLRISPISSLTKGGPRGPRRVPPRGPPAVARACPRGRGQPARDVCDMKGCGKIANGRGVSRANCGRQLGSYPPLPGGERGSKRLQVAFVKPFPCSFVYY